MKKNLPISLNDFRTVGGGISYKKAVGTQRETFFYPIQKIVLLLLVMLSVTSLYGQRQMESLGRGVVAVRTSSSEVFVSWRVLGTEPADLGFNLYRGETKLNDIPITGATNFVDASTTSETYSVAPVINGVEQEKSAPATVWAQNHLTIPIQQPAGGTTPDGVSYTYTANDCSTGDLDGDGEYEVVLKWDPTNSKDNSQSGYTGNVIIDAYKMDGTRMWRIDLGRNIRAGAHYTQFIVYDLDSDGKAEVAFKTADGTVDGVGTVIGNAGADYRDTNGRILTGPEFLTVFNGETGAAMATTDYVPARGNVADWGDNYGNRVDRFLAGVGYFDGQRPSLVMSRGYYTRTVIAAWDWRNGQLTQRWKFDSNDAGNEAYYGQGYHSLSINDVDFDGKDEVVFGSMVVDDNGTGLYSTELGHGDAQHVGDLDPERPGLESWSAHEDVNTYDENGLWMRDAGTGEKLWGVPATWDVGRALAADIDPRYKGYEAWGAAGNLYSVKGQEIATSKPKMNFAIWWDGDLLREILDGDIMDKWNYNTSSHDRLFTIYQTGASKINGTKANPNLTADILGDWREEMIYRHWDNTKLMVYTTTIPTEERIYTLMHDPQYRVSVAWQNVGYNQPPHTSFYLGHDMQAPPTPAIALVENEGPGTPIIYLAASAGDSQVDLSWSVTNAELSSLEIYRDTDADPSGRSRIASLGGSSRTYTDNTASNDTTYYYWVKARDVNSVIINSNTAHATPESNEPEVVPGIVLSATAVNSQIELDWDVTGLDLRGQEIMRDTDPNPSGRGRIASLGGADRSFIDANVVDGVTYYYWLKATDVNGVVTNSNAASATAVVDGSPGIPAVELEAAGGFEKISLSWTIANMDVRGMDILRDTDPDPAGRGRIASLGADARSFTDNNVEVGVTYYYWVKVTDTNLAVTNSNTASATAKAWPTIELSATGKDAMVELSWIVSNTELSRLEIYRDTDSNPSGRGRIASLSGDARDYVDNTAENGVTYYYWIKAWDLDGIQLGSPAASATPVAPPSVTLLATGKDARVELSWEVLNVDFVSQEVYRDSDDNPEGRERIASLSGDARTYVDESAVNGTTYYYWIKGKDANAVVTNSNAAEGTPLPLDGAYTIVIRHSGKVLDNNKSCVENTNGNGNIIQQSAGESGNQVWTLSSVEGGYYIITNSNCGQAMGVKAQSATAEGANILQWTYAGDINQHWLVKESGDGYYSIINRGTGMAATVEAGSLDDGANVKQWSYAGAENQQFSLRLVEENTQSVNVAYRSINQNLELEKNGVLVYPNPVEGAFKIKAKGAFDYTIFDQVGRIALQGSGENQVQLGAGLSSGLYMINVYANGSMQQIQLIKH